MFIVPIIVILAVVWRYGIKTLNYVKSYVIMSKKIKRPQEV